MTKEQIEHTQFEIKELLERNTKLKIYMDSHAKEGVEDPNDDTIGGMLIGVNAIYRHILTNFF